MVRSIELVFIQASVDQIQERLSTFVPGGQSTVNEVVKIPPDGQMAEQGRLEFVLLRFARVNFTR